MHLDVPFTVVFKCINICLNCLHLNRHSKFLMGSEEEIESVCVLGVFIESANLFNLLTLLENMNTTMEIRRQFLKKPLS